MTPVEIVQELVGILVAGISELGAGIGSGISSFATSLAFVGTGSDQAFSIFFVLILVFAGVSLAIGLTTKIFMWLSSLGSN